MIFYAWQLMLHDAAEIVVLSVIVYGLLRWVQRDEKSNLLMALYSYWGVAAAAYLINFSTVFYVALLMFPAFIAALIIFHKEQLQKNFIGSTKLTLSQTQGDWLDTLMRSLLQSMNEGHACAVIVENDDALDLKIPFTLNADCSKELMKLLASDVDFDQTKLLWLTKNGIVKAFNAVPHHDSQKDSLHAMRTWQCDALVITLRTDAIVLGIDPRARTFIVIAQGKMLEGVNVKAALRIMKQYLFESLIVDNEVEKGHDYAVFNKKTAQHQKRA